MNVLTFYRNKVKGFLICTCTESGKMSVIHEIHAYEICLDVL